MPPLEDVHIHEIDRATSRLELIRVNPTRSWMLVPIDPETHQWRGAPALYTWQNGCWYGTGGTPLSEDVIPEECRRSIAENPVIVTTTGPAVTAVCKFCGERMNTAEMNVHLIQHVEQTLAQAGTVKPNPKDSPQKADVNTHHTPRG